MLDTLRYYLFMAWVWIGHKSFGWHYLDIYSPNSDKDPNADVVGITFSSSEDYIKRIQDLEGGETING